MEIIKSYVTKNECYQVARKITVKGLMLHSVGCPQPSAKIWATSIYNQYMPNGAEVCVHAFLQSDGKVYQTLPWNYEGWHAGGSANKTHIGVEMAEPDCIKYVGGATFTCSDLARAKAQVTGTYNTAVQLFAYLCKEYNLDPLKDGVIISHAEGYKRGVASGHADPTHLWSQLGMSYTMDGFRKAVKAAMGGNTTVVEDKPKNVNYTVKVTATDGLNVRKAAGTSSAVVRTLANGTKVAVTKEQGGWGYIGEGWISLEWTEKVAKAPKPVKQVYRIRKTWDNPASQIGAYESLENAKKACKTGYKVFDNNGKVVYSPFVAYLFRANCDVLNIRKGPGTNYAVVGQIKDKLKYTIVEEKSGTGSSKGWGRLKAGGWVALDWIVKA